MIKKKIVVMVTSLLIVCGIGYGNYIGVSQGSTATQTAKMSSKHTTKKVAQTTTRSTDVTSDSKITKNVKASMVDDHTNAKVTSKKATAKASTKEDSTVAVEATNKEAESIETAPTTPAPTLDNDDASNQVSNVVDADTEVANSTPAPTPQAEEVKLSIYGPISDGNQKWLNNDVVSMTDGESVYDVLKHDLDSKGMKLSKSGIGSTTYVRGINGMFEFDKGPLSGWLYRVNGVFPDHSCGDYYVKSGDVIDWMYTEDLGNDRNAPQV